MKIGERQRCANMLKKIGDRAIMHGAITCSADLFRHLLPSCLVFDTSDIITNLSCMLSFSLLGSARYHGVSTSLDLCLLIFGNIWRSVGVLLGLMWEG